MNTFYSTPLNAEQLNENRQFYIDALRAETHQCYGKLFEGDCVCAIGLAYREFYGVRSVFDFAVGNGDVIAGVARALDIDQVPTVPGRISVDAITEMNDRDMLTLPEIGDKLAEKWGLE